MNINVTAVTKTGNYAKNVALVTNKYTGEKCENLLHSKRAKHSHQKMGEMVDERGHEPQEIVGV
jgi:hypothetical protein